MGDELDLLLMCFERCKENTLFLVGELLLTVGVFLFLCSSRQRLN